MKVFYLVFLFIFFEDFVIKNRGIVVNNQKKKTITFVKITSTWSLDICLRYKLVKDCMSRSVQFN